MVIAHGFLSIMGVGSESTLGTAVAATQKVCYLDESLQETINEILDNSLCGTAARKIGQPGTKIIEGGFSYPWRANLGDLVLQRFFGQRLIDTPSVGTNTYVLDPSIDGDGLTVAIDKQVSVFEFAGYKSSSLTITGTPADGIVIEVDGFAVSLSLTSVLNTSVSLAALADGGFQLLLQDATIRIADLADALQASDALQVSEFAIELNRNLEAVEVNSRNRTEALENNFRESTFTFTIPQYQSNFFVTAHRNHTALQADISIVNGARTKLIKMPKLIVTEYSNPIGGPEFPTLEVTCQIIPDPENTNTFMSLQDNNSEIEIQES